MSLHPVPLTCSCTRPARLVRWTIRRLPRTLSVALFWSRLLPTRHRLGSVLQYSRAPRRPRNGPCFRGSLWPPLFMTQIDVLMPEDHPAFPHVESWAKVYGVRMLTVQPESGNVLFMLSWPYKAWPVDYEEAY